MPRTCICGMPAGKLDIVCDRCGAVLGSPPEIDEPLETEYIPPTPPVDKKSNKPIGKEDWARWRAQIKTMVNETVAETVAEQTAPPVVDEEIARLVALAKTDRPSEGGGDIENQAAAFGAALLGAIFPGSRMATVVGTAFGKYVGSEMKSGAKLMELGTDGRKPVPAKPKKRTRRKKSTE